MTKAENANMIQFLQSIGWTDAQIMNMMLCLDGYLTIEEASEKHQEAGRS